MSNGSNCATRVTDDGTLTIADFLLERIAEDEQVATAASPSPWQFSGVDSVGGGGLYDQSRVIANVLYEQPSYHDGKIVRHLLASEADANGAHISRFDPARVLAECKAKRAIVGNHDGERSGTTGDYCSFEDGRFEIPCPELRQLAAVYASHPDYRPAWAPE